MAQFVDRMIRASKLDVRLYEEVQTNPKTIKQALGIVLLSSLAAGIGDVVHGGITGLIIGTITTLLGWHAWAYLTYIIGAKFFPMPETSTNRGELLRTLGFASTPGLLRVFGLVPGLTGIAFLVAAIWMLMATVIATRQALHYTSTIRAIGVCVIGWFVQLLIMLPLFVLFGGD